MRDTIPPTPDGLQREGFTCEHCGRVVTTSIEGLFHNPNRGSHQRFCDHACRQAAYRRRTAGVPETSPPSAAADATDHSHNKTNTTEGVNFQPTIGGQFSSGVDNKYLDANSLLAG
jgi:hypothetical protein